MAFCSVRKSTRAAGLSTLNVAIGQRMPGTSANARPRARLAWGLVTGCAVDPVADEVGVAVMARVLLDQVQADPADVPGALRVVTVAGHDASG
jgi:hypothetical protein